MRYKTKGVCPMCHNNKMERFWLWVFNGIWILLCITLTVGAYVMIEDYVGTVIRNQSMHQQPPHSCLSNGTSCGL